MRKSTIGIGAFFLGLSALVFIESLRVKSQLGAADFRTPLRPDTYLTMLGIVIAVVSFLYLVKEGFLEYEGIKRSGSGLRDAVLTMVMFIGHILVMGWVGYAVSTFLFYLFFLRVVGRYSYLATLAISVVVTACYELVFVKWANIAVPVGIVENLLFQ